jgi:hypothetical protein
MSAIKPFKNAPVTLTPYYEKVKEGEWLVHLKVTPPGDCGASQGQVFTFIFDVSGSMGTNACKVGDDAINYHTRLDLLKLVAELQVKMLTPDDYVYLIAFSDNARVLLPPTKMTEAGRASAIAAIKGMRTEGSTNLWNSLELAYGELSKPEYAETNKHVIMLTDGEESFPANHPGGTAGAFASLKQLFNLQVIGFSEAVKPDLPANLCKTAGGRFSNVADFTTLATTSINATAIAQNTCVSSTTIVVTYGDGSTSDHSTSLIQYGQDRNLVFSVRKQPVTASSNRTATLPFVEGLSLEAKCRFDLMAAIRQAIDRNGTVNPYTTVYSKYGVSSVSNHVTEIHPTTGGLVLGLGANWQKWGSKYSWAYLQALENDHRMNFKEQGQAHLCGAAFERLKAHGDTVFSSIPKPIATGTSATAAQPSGYGYGYGGGYVMPTVRTVASVTATNDPTQSGGCWAPWSKILMADMTRKALYDLAPGDRVWTKTGVGTVDYVVELGTLSPQLRMCVVGDLVLTEYHPVYDNGVWRSACDLAPVKLMPMPKLINFLLDYGHVVDIDGVLTVSLGHGLTETGLEHPYFGSRARLLEDMRGQPGFQERRVVFRNLQYNRDPVSGLICGWYDGF